MTHPTVTLDHVWHVGTLDPAERAHGSYEGDGLSVSLHPDGWAHIARLGGPTWQFSLPAGPLTLLDAHACDRDAIMRWACERGWVRREAAYAVTYFDDEFDAEMTMVVSDHDEALAEAAEREADLSATEQWVATDAHPCTRPDLMDAGDVSDQTLVEWVRHATDLHGVWWEEDYAPQRLSCPRGALTVPLADLRVHPVAD